LAHLTAAHHHSQWFNGTHVSHARQPAATFHLKFTGSRSRSTSHLHLHLTRPRSRSASSPSVQQHQGLYSTCSKFPSTLSVLGTKGATPLAALPYLHGPDPGSTGQHHSHYGQLRPATACLWDVTRGCNDLPLTPGSPSITLGIDVCHTTGNTGAEQSVGATRGLASCRCWREVELLLLDWRWANKYINALGEVPPSE
jgi:hypothetical protein